MRKFKPFYLNLNLCQLDTDISKFENFSRIIASNTGNSYIGYSMVKIINGGYKKVDNIPNIWNYDFSDTNKDTNFINNNYTHVIFCLQDHINNFPYFKNLPFGKINDFLKKIKLPLLIAGIGCNSTFSDYADLPKHLRGDLLKFLNIISDKTEVIGTRGEMTSELLNKLGIKNNAPVGCPTFFEALNPNKRIIKKPSSENLKVLYNNPQLLYGAKDPDLVLQDEINAIRTLSFDEVFLRNNFHPYEQNFVKLMLKNKLTIFSNMDDWKNYTKNFDFVFGTRVHGAILALNSIKDDGHGVPVIIMNRDVRSKEMTDLFKIPYYIMPDNYELPYDKNVKYFYEEVDYEPINKAYPKLYSDFMNWLEINGIQRDESNTSFDEAPSLKLKNPNQVLNSIFRDLEIKSFDGYKQKREKKFLYIDVCKRKANKTKIRVY